MSRGITGFLWQLSVALYLVANGILGLQKSGSGDFSIIFSRVGLRGGLFTVVVLITSVIALIAGIAIVLDMFEVELPFLDTLVFVIAVIWAVYIVIEIISWIMSGFKGFLGELQLLAVHIMVLASLLVASRKFD